MKFENEHAPKTAPTVKAGNQVAEEKKESPKLHGPAKGLEGKFAALEAKFELLDKELDRLYELNHMVRDTRG